MTLTGACPGTVFPQVAVRIASGLFVLLGGLIGGIMWVTVGTSLRQNPQSVHAPQSIGSKGKGEQSPTRKAIFSPALAVYVSFCLLAIIIATFVAPSTQVTAIHPILGGLLIGAAQASSVFLTGSTLGLSTAYGDAAAWLRYWIQSSRTSTASKAYPRPPTKSIRFVLGVLAGSYAYSKLSSYQLPSRSSELMDGVIPDVDVQISRLTAVLGGCIMIFGSRLAGGCTSGHGISGMAMLDPASFITVGGMFMGGMGLAAFLK